MKLKVLKSSIDFKWNHNIETIIHIRNSIV